jgi:prepilin-type processing-associated H-X9-DG protein
LFTAAGYRIAGDFFFSFRHFQPLSNELVTPKLLLCPADTRLPAASLASLENDNLSYFVGLKSDYSHPNSILAGDRNITNDLTGTSTLMRFQSNGAFRWTSELHQFKGNLLFADGHVDERKTPTLMTSYEQAPGIVELALPTVRRNASNNGVPKSSIAGSAIEGNAAELSPQKERLNDVRSTPLVQPAVSVPSPADSQSLTGITDQSRPAGALRPKTTRAQRRSQASLSFLLTLQPKS